MRRASAWAWLVALGAVGVVVIACNNPTSSDSIYPACNGDSAEGLATESSSSGQCPSSPVILIGTGASGAACSQASDCKPTCCTCPHGPSALVSQCEGTSCLDGADVCCLYQQQCGQ